MKKISIFMLTVVLLFGFQTLAFAERQPVGETVVKDNMLFINGNSIPAAQLPNAFVYVPVDDLEWYGFDVERKVTDDKRIYIVTRNAKKSVYAGGAAAILYRIAKFLGNKTMPTAVNAVYADEDKISDWAKSSVACMNAMGIMNGVSENEFAPKQTYTAEQAVATMLRMYEYN